MVDVQLNKPFHIVLPPQQIKTRKLALLSQLKLANSFETIKMLMGRLLGRSRRKEQRRFSQPKKVTIKERYSQRKTLERKTHRRRRKYANLSHSQRCQCFRIHPRYLELEPLCCLSSCLVRTGCCSVAVFQLAITAVTVFVIAFKIYDGGRMDMWDELDMNFNALITHQLSLYLLGMFQLITLFMSFCLLYGIFTFERKFVKMHWRFDFFALGSNVVAFFLFVFALNSEGPETWTWENVLLLMAFASQIPLQIWAVCVVKACYDFYVLLYVFVSLSEK